jgi:hypothetical protein
MQESMLVHEAIEGRPIYNAPLCFDIEGDIDADALRRAFESVARRHPILLSTYQLDTGLALVGAATPPDLVAPQRWADFWTQQFDLAREPPVRLGLTSDGDHHTFGMCVHHVAGDSWSVDILLRDLGTAYNALARGREPGWPTEAPSFFDYADAERAQRYDTSWWSRSLAGIEPPPGPRADPPPEDERGRCHRVRLPLGTTHTQGVRRLARTMRVSPAAILFTAVSMTVDAPVVGLPVVLRDTTTQQRIVGPLLNMLPVVTPQGAPTNRAKLIQRHAEAMESAIQHKNVPYSRILATRPASGQLFLHAVNVDPVIPRLGLAGTRVTPVPVPPVWAIWPALWDFSWPTVGNLRGDLAVSASDFAPEQLPALVDGFLASLEWLLEKDEWSG